MHFIHHDICRFSSTGFLIFLLFISLTWISSKLWRTCRHKILNFKKPCSTCPKGSKNWCHFWWPKRRPRRKPWSTWGKGLKVKSVKCEWLKSHPSKTRIRTKMQGVFVLGVQTIKLLRTNINLKKSIHRLRKSTWNWKRGWKLWKFKLYLAWILVIWA